MDRDNDIHTVVPPLSKCWCVGGCTDSLVMILTELKCGLITDQTSISSLPQHFADKKLFPQVERNHSLISASQVAGEGPSLSELVTSSVYLS